MWRVESGFTGAWLDRTTRTTPSTSSLPIDDSSLSNTHLPLHSRVFGFCRVRLFPPLLVLLVLIQLIVLPVRLALSVRLEAYWMDDRLLDVLYVVLVLITDYLDVVLPSSHKGGEAAGGKPANGEEERGFSVASAL